MKYLDTLYIGSAAAIWGTLGVIASLMTGLGFEPTEISAFRVVISAVVILCCAIMFPFFRIDIRGLSRCLPLAVTQSVFGVLLYNLAYFESVRASGVTFAVCLLYTAPVWALFFSICFLKERFEWWKAYLAAGSLVGAILVVYSGEDASNIGVAGLLMGLASGACYALYPTLGQLVLRQVDSRTLLASSFGISALFFVATPYFWRGSQRLLLEPSIAAWSLVLGISLFGTLFSYFLFTRGLRTVQASAVAVITTIEPLTAILLVAVFFDQTLGAAQYLSVALILFTSIRSGQLGTRQGDSQSMESLARAQDGSVSGRRTAQTRVQSSKRR